MSRQEGILFQPIRLVQITWRDIGSGPKQDRSTAAFTILSPFPYKLRALRSDHYVFSGPILSHSPSTMHMQWPMRDGSSAAVVQNMIGPARLL